MKLCPYERKNLKSSYRFGSNQRILYEFANSGLDCVKLEDYPHKSAKVCQSSLRTASRRIGLANTVRIHVEGENVFLLRVTNDDQ